MQSYVCMFTLCMYFLKLCGEGTIALYSIKMHIVMHHIMSVILMFISVSKMKSTRSLGGGR